MSTPLAVTRIVNACALIELGPDAILTDPYFRPHWFVPMREPIGLTVSGLPRLSAIVGGHGVFDHWQPTSLDAYAWKVSTPVLVATSAMARSARAAGFTDVSVPDWGDRVTLSPRLSIEVVPAQRVTGMRTHNYLLAGSQHRVFVGTEARDMAPLVRWAGSGQSADVALLPIDGSSLFAHRLVMRAADAHHAAHVLGVRYLIPFHYALRQIAPLFRTPTGLRHLLALASQARTVTVVPLATGTRWTRPQDEPAKLGAT